MRFIEQQKVNVETQLKDFALLLASVDGDGHWWGHDTDLGDITPDIEEAGRAMLSIVVNGRLELLQLILKYHCRRGSELETFLHKKIAEHKKWLALLPAPQSTGEQR